MIARHIGPHLKMSFHMELSSASETYKDNTAGSFRIQVKPTIPLKGRWEVAMTDIHYPNVKNVYDAYILAGERTYTLAPGYYGNVEQLVSVIAAFNIAGFTLRYIDRMQKVYYVTASKIQYSPILAAILGFDSTKEYTGRGYGEDTVDLERGIKPILFQTPLISPQIFRETRRPVLRSLYSQGEHTPKYCSVIDTDLDEINFTLTTVDNKALEFTPGAVDFTLHFRPCNQD